MWLGAMDPLVVASAWWAALEIKVEMEVGIEQSR
jgi:hypothetical protein